MPHTADDEAWSTALAALPEHVVEEINRLWTIVRAFSNTAHAVNNSLQVIGGSAELLERRDGLDPALLRRVQAIRLHSGRAASVLDDLLSYSRGGGSEPEALELGALVNTAVEMRTHTLSRARIALTLDRSDAEPYWVMTRRWMLLQLLLNVFLVLESRLAGRAQARIIVSLVRASGKVHVGITSGSGPPEGMLASLRIGWSWDLSHRVTRQLAEQLGAALTMEQASNGLPTFTLTLPPTAAKGAVTPPSIRG